RVLDAVAVRVLENGAADAAGTAEILRRRRRRRKRSERQESGSQRRGSDMLQRSVDKFLRLFLHRVLGKLLRHLRLLLGKACVRFLLINNHCITDPTAGVTQSLRTIVEWLADAGHECRILTTARFESRVTFTIEEHLRERGVEVSRNTQDRIVRYTGRNVPITLLLTRYNDEMRPNTRETRRYLALVDELLR